MSWWRRGQASLAALVDSAGETKRQFLILIQVCCLYNISQDYGITFSMVQGPSMLPTFSEVGDILAVERFPRFHDRLRVGDVVIFKSPQDRNNAVCKRIIAKEKDFVEIERSHPLYRGETRIKVPKGHVWVEGDNKTNSTDSRVYGPVPVALICGRAIYRVWPLSGLGPIKRDHVYLPMADDTATKGRRYY